MRHVDLGDGLDISAVSLGSWNTFSRMSFEDLIDLIRAALDMGVNTFDVGYYWDKPYTEVIFGRAMQVVGAPRADYRIAEKLWLWDYPEVSFEAQLKRALVRLDLDYVDLIMVSRPTPDLDFAAFCQEVTALIDKGLARGWGLTNWSAAEIRQAQAQADRPSHRPRMVQLQYNVCRRSVVESDAFKSLFAETDIKLCPALTLEGGILAGHMNRDRVQPSEFSQGTVPLERNIARDSGGVREQVREKQAELEAVAKSFGVTAAQAALAFCLANPATATALIGVTKLSDLKEDVAALELAERAGPALLKALQPLSVEGVVAPKLFNPHNDE